MFQSKWEPSDRLLCIHFTGDVDAREMTSCFQQVKEQLEKSEPGFRLLTDLTGLESMDALCAPILGAFMDFLAGKQIAMVVRVIPDPQKDIGFNLMSQFHYGRRVRTVTFENLAGALELLTAA